MHDDVKPTGVLEQLRLTLGGNSLNIQAYAGILSILGAGGYRDESLGMSGDVDYGDDHFTCFQFAYDWRRDNVENARLLHDFIKEKRAYLRRQYKQRFGIDKKDIKFDIAAHSMGGLITRYFLMYGSQDLPYDGSLLLVGGDAAETTRTISVNSKDGSQKIIATGFGDETVLRASALADERMTGKWKPRIQSPIDFSTVFFLPYNHLELTQNMVFRNNVLFWLLEDPR